MEELDQETIEITQANFSEVGGNEFRIQTMIIKGKKLSDGKNVTYTDLPLATKIKISSKVERIIKREIRNYANYL